ncbi:hypothetical protein CDD83_4782 [Cordyceps sp. RAO-2017]|nr:hypothetical protein CDD83_4782 [Cordyceps sp. RAO-2017]
MAGALASNRLTPPSTGASLPWPRRVPSLSGQARTLRSPHLLPTLRQPAKSVGEAERRKKYHHHKLRGGNHAHHEGSRKRWREQMTQRERKRYEAVWASNRGLLLEPEAPGPGNEGGVSEYVANVVVRELWRRSRLPEDELAEVWELVDRRARGTLSRPEFVVGMWLIDQRLRGRKLPQKISDSLWGSANGLVVLTPKTRRK